MCEGGSYMCVPRGPLSHDPSMYTTTHLRREIIPVNKKYLWYVSIIIMMVIQEQMGWADFLKLRLLGSSYSSAAARWYTDAHYLADIFPVHDKMLHVLDFAYVRPPLTIFIHVLIVLPTDLCRFGAFWWVHVDVWDINQTSTEPDQHRSEEKWSKTDIYWNKPTLTVISWAGYIFFSIIW